MDHLLKVGRLQLTTLRARRNRLVAPYIGFVLLFFSCGAAAGTGQVQSAWIWLLALLVVCALPILLLNLSLHTAIQKVDPTAGSSGLKQTIISSFLVTPVEAALILPAINLTIATRILRRDSNLPGQLSKGNLQAEPACGSNDPGPP